MDKKASINKRPNEDRLCRIWLVISLKWLYDERTRQKAAFDDSQRQGCEEILDVFLGVRMRLKAVITRQLRYEREQENIFRSHLPPKPEFTGNTKELRKSWVEQGQAVELVHQLKEFFETPSRGHRFFIYGCGMLTLLEVTRSVEVKMKTLRDEMKEFEKTADTLQAALHRR